MGKTIDITNMKFNNLTAIEKVNSTHWLFQCDCGTKKTIERSKVVRNETKSCGCIRKAQFFSHGMGRTRFYRIYTAAKCRCENSNAASYENYGARGIKFEFTSFEHFRDTLYKSYLDHVKKYGEFETTIDRKDNMRNYSPENCKWSTRLEQNNNRRARRWHKKPVVA